MQAPEELVERVVKFSQVPRGKRRRDIQRELRSHIEDFIEAARERGYDNDEIERMVVASFGDPAQIAQAFAWVYRRERAAASTGVFLLSSLAVTALILGAIVTLQASIAIGFGTPLWRVLTSPHTAIEALDILFTVITYTALVALERLFERNRSWKALGVVAVALAIVTVARMTVDFRAPFLVFGIVNGAFFRAIQVFVKNGAARTGIVAAALVLLGAIFVPSMTFRFPYALARTCASWIAMAAAYRHMPDAVARMEAALSHRFQRM
jgi:hypothetical protein